MDTMDMVDVYRGSPDVIDGVRDAVGGRSLLVIPDVVAESAGVCKELSGKDWDDLKTLESDIMSSMATPGVPVEFACLPGNVLAAALKRANAECANPDYVPAVACRLHAALRRGRHRQRRRHDRRQGIARCCGGCTSLRIFNGAPVNLLAHAPFCMEVSSSASAGQHHTGGKKSFWVVQPCKRILQRTRDWFVISVIVHIMEFARPAHGQYFVHARPTAHKYGYILLYETDADTICFERSRTATIKGPEKKPPGAAP